MKNIRLGIIGLGIMGSSHARQVAAGRIRRMKLAAVADANPVALAAFGGVAQFTDPNELIHSGLVDAVLIATPHYSHTTVGIEALRAGLHVLVEKPISVHRRDAERLIAAHRRRRQVFAAMFNQRTDPCYRKLRSLIQTGRLGKVRRVQWTVTNWFRPNVYYRSGGWRATWAGEGGGVLLNQCPHNLDLISWLFGQPKRVRGFCAFGRYHDIEVEDDVTAYLELGGGAHMTFITSTGEAPGTNRLEVAGENGRVVVEDGVLEFTRNRVPTSEFSRTTKGAFTKPETQVHRFTFKDAGLQHLGVMRNFAEAVLDGKALVAPASEGIRSVELANAILLSSWTGAAVALPLDGRTYERHLKAKIAGSRLRR